jgi:hypothetical protein
MTECPIIRLSGESGAGSGNETSPQTSKVGNRGAVVILASLRRRPGREAGPKSGRRALTAHSKGVAAYHLRHTKGERT